MKKHLSVLLSLLMTIPASAAQKVYRPEATGEWLLAANIDSFFGTGEAGFAGFLAAIAGAGYAFSTPYRIAQESVDLAPEAVTVANIPLYYIAITRAKSAL